MTVIHFDPPGYRPYKGDLPPGSEMYRDAAKDNKVWATDDAITNELKREGITPVGEAHAPNAELEDMVVKASDVAKAKLDAVVVQAALHDSQN